MVKGSDLVLWILRNTRTNENMTYTRLHKTIYLIEEAIKEKKPDFQPFYKFEDFMSHAGPYDQELQEDLEILFDTGCVKNIKNPYDKTSDTPVLHDNVKISFMGDRYTKNHASGELEEFLGKENYREIEKKLSEYDKKPQIILIKESMEKWGKEHPNKKIADLIPQVQGGK